MLTAASAFALFLMLALASIVYFIAQRFALPFTVLLTFVGIILVPISSFEPFSFLREFQLTPEILFFIFLPTLLFESAYAMNIRRIVDELSPILLLSIGAYLVSSLLIGGGLFFAFGAIGFPIPFLVALLFGALISATDPVAVLALFKEYGAPRRLSLIFEGESLLNDATALALFLVVLGLLEAGVTAGTLTLGALTFVTMLVGGVLLGFAVAGVLVQLMGLFRNNEIVAVTLMIVVAHSTFLTAELLNQSLAQSNIPWLQFSPIIATTAASVLMGNYGRFKLRPSAEEFVEKFWSQFAFMANSLVFILVGFLFASIPSGAETLLIPAVTAVIVVAAARALSVYGTLLPFNALSQKEGRIPPSWLHLLSWGSLRGALAVMLVLLIPRTLSVSGWTHDLSVQDTLLVLTVTSIFATLFIKAPTIGPFMRKLKIGLLTPLEEAALFEAKALIHGTVHLKLKKFSEKGYVPEPIAEKLVTEHRHALRAKEEAEEAPNEGAALRIEQMLRLYLIGLEKEELKQLLTFDEINERVFKRIYGKLTLRGEAVEHGTLEANSVPIRDYRDIFETMAEFLRKIIKPKQDSEDVRQDYLYYRTQAILAGKVLKELARLKEMAEMPVFSAEMLERSEAIYTWFRESALACVKHIKDGHPAIVEALDEILAYRSVYRVEAKELKRLRGREMLTPKLSIALHERYEQEALMQETVTRAAMKNAANKET